MSRNAKYLILILIMAVSAVYCITFFEGYVDVSDGSDYAGLARSLIRGSAE